MTNRNPDRRLFIRTSMAVAASGLTYPLAADESAEAQVFTVAGAVKRNELGTMLPHEHVLVDFIGADKVSTDRYDRDEAYEIVLPHLKRLRELGCQALAECTPAYLGRDPELLLRLSKATGVQLLTNTGYYGARNGKFLPKHALTETEDQLSERWLGEWKDGIDGTDIRPGFIKIGVDAGALTDVNRKLLQAAARTHLKSGLTIAGHTGDGRAALEQVEVLRKEGVHGSAWIWVHAQNERDNALHVQAARQGAWVEFDGVSPTSIEKHVRLVQNMKQQRVLNRVLISHDAGWYSVGEPRGGKFRDYETVFAEFLPALKRAGFSDDELRLLTVTNPAQAFAVHVRSRR